MKTTIQLGLLLLLMTVAFVSPSSAQTMQKQMTDIAKKWEAVYNQQNTKALQDFYTKSATYTGTDGKMVTGNEAIAAFYKGNFGNETGTKITVTCDKVEAGANGTLITSGSWHQTGTAKANGQAYDIKGTYTNTMVKEDGQWKIAKSVSTVQ